MKKLIGLLSSLLILGSAHAEIISYDFTATINSISERGFLEYPGTEVSSSTKAGVSYSIGDIIHGHFEYDTTTGLGSYQPDQPPNGSYTLYQSDDALNKLTATSSSGATLPALSPAPLLQVSYEAGGAHFFNLSRSDFLDNSIQTTSLMFMDIWGNWLHNSAIPTGSLADVPYQNFNINYFFFDDWSSLDVNASITSLTLVSSVPEPATYLMLMAGLLALAACRRRNPALPSGV